MHLLFRRQSGNRGPALATGALLDCRTIYTRHRQDGGTRGPYFETRIVTSLATASRTSQAHQRLSLFTIFFFLAFVFFALLFLVYMRACARASLLTIVFGTNFDCFDRLSWSRGMRALITFQHPPRAGQKLEHCVVSSRRCGFRVPAFRGFD